MYPGVELLVRKEEAVTNEQSIDRIARLSGALESLRPSQLNWIESVVEQFGRPATFWRWDGSDVVTPCVLDDFGDALRIRNRGQSTVSPARGAGRGSIPREGASTMESGLVLTQKRQTTGNRGPPSTSCP